MSAQEREPTRRSWFLNPWEGRVDTECFGLLVCQVRPSSNGDSAGDLPENNSSPRNTFLKRGPSPVPITNGHSEGGCCSEVDQKQIMEHINKKQNPTTNNIKHINIKQIMEHINKNKTKQQTKSNI